MRSLLLVLLLFVGKITSTALVPIPKVFDFPNDLPTIEALMSLHKLSASEEQKALNRLNLSLATTTGIEKVTSKFQQGRELLDTRTNSIYSYVLFAARLAFLTKGFSELTTSFTHFTAASSSDLFKKPTCAWYYAEAVSACRQEIKNMTAMLGRLGIAQIDLLQATMAEKLELIATIQVAVDNCKRIIEDAYFWCSFMVHSGFNRLFLEDIFESKLTDQIAHNVINLYHKL